MKIAVTAQGKDITSRIDPRFGRARFILICDTETESVDVIDNTQNMQAAHGAGVQTSQAVVGRGVATVVSGAFGPKASQILGAANIAMITWSEGTVNEAIELIKSNKLQVSGS